jgi:hypothetical protein
MIDKIKCNEKCSVGVQPELIRIIKNIEIPAYWIKSPCYFEGYLVKYSAR